MGIRFFFALLTVIFVAASAWAQDKNTASSGEQAQKEKQPPYTVPDDPNKLPQYALLITSKGPVEIKLYRELAPESVANFEYLAKSGFYEGLSFHRYLENFVIQGGDPLGTGKGGPGWSLSPNFHPDIQHVQGTIGWARKQGVHNPERRSNGSQFYICLSAQPRLDGFYTAFGVVVRGMQNVLRLRKGDKILKIRFPTGEYSSGW